MRFPPRAKTLICALLALATSGGAATVSAEGGARETPETEARDKAFQQVPDIHTHTHAHDETACSAPVEHGWVASGFGYRQARRRRRRQFHAGLDFASPHGTPVLAAADGIVSHVARERRHARIGFTGYGNTVVVYHPPTETSEARWSMYAHLSEMFVQEGMLVSAGEKVGLVGNTNNRKFGSMASHLHFEVRHARSDGSAPFPGAYRAYNVDPLPWLVELGVALGPRREVGLSLPGGILHRDR